MTSECMCVYAPEAINNYKHDINPIWLVKQILKPLYGSYSRLLILLGIRPQPIMLKILPIMLLSRAQKVAYYAQN